MAVPMLWRASQIFRYSDQIIAFANHVVSIDCSAIAKRFISNPPLFATQPFLAIPEQIAAIPCFAVTIRHAAVPLRHLGVLCHDSSSRRLSFALFIRSYPLHCSSFPVAPALCLYKAQRCLCTALGSSVNLAFAIRCDSSPIRHRSLRCNPLPSHFLAMLYFATAFRQ